MQTSASPVKTRDHAPSWRGPVLVAFALFALINAANALHKGGDFDVFLEAGRRIGNATPLYEGSSPGSGVIGPPFHAVLFAPLAALDARHSSAAALLWYLLNLTSLVAGVAWWSRALDPNAGGILWTSATLFPVAAILLPAQTNFEHQNMSPLLLALTGACALGVRRCAHVATGVALGAAIALKAFPGLLLIPLCVKRDWRSASIAVVVAMLLTAATAFSYGMTGAITTAGAWIDLARQPAWPTRMQNQSVYAMLSRASAEYGPALATLAGALLLGVLTMVCVRRRRVALKNAAPELALALCVAVLLSPIAWDHYWVLMFPAFRIVYVANSRRRALNAPPVAAPRAAFWASAMLVTGLSPLTVGRSLSNALRRLSASTIAGVILIVGVIAALERSESEEPAPTPTP